MKSKRKSKIIKKYFELLQNKFKVTNQPEKLAISGNF